MKIEAPFLDEISGLVINLKYHNVEGSIHMKHNNLRHD